MYMNRIVGTLLMVCIGWASIAQDGKTVSGKVIDEEYKEGVPFVTIAKKGTTSGTSTDIEGNYTLQVSDSDTLIFRMVGYEPYELIVAGASSFDVTLKLKLLKEIVVVGYGTQEAEDITGSIVSVESEEITKVAVAGSIDALQGRASGVEVVNNNGAPGQNSEIRIRGIGSINGGSPLVIVDGIFLDGGAVNAIAPQDIESVDIIKDASAAAIYGARAANGVILITTKKGKKGQLNVTYDTYYGSQRLIKKIDVMNAQQYAEAQNIVADNRGEDRNDLWAFPEDYAGTGTDWQDALFQNGSIYNSHFNISGGGESSTYSLSLDYFNEQGVVPYSFYERYSLRNNMTFDLSKYFKAGVNLGIMRDGGRQPASFGGDFMENNTLLTATGIDPTIEPVRPFFATTDTVSLVPEWHYLYKEGDSLAWNNTPRDNIKNPIAAISRGSKNYGMSWVDKILPSAYLEFTPVEWLKLRSSAGSDYSIQNEWWYNPVYYIDGNDQRADTTDSFGQKYERWFSYNWTNTAEFKKKFNRHNTSIMLGMDVQEWRRKDFGWDQKNLGGRVNNEIEANLLVTDLYKSNHPATRNIWGGFDYWRFLSYFGRVNYDYDDRYFLTVNLRRDGSSRFGPRNRFGNFPGFSTGWKIHNEKFFRDLQESGKLNFLTFAKLRGGYGVLGNANGAGTFDYNSRPSINNSSVVFGPDNRNNIRAFGSTIDFVDNPELRWEKFAMTNYAMDLSFLNNKIWFTGEYYIRNTTDMIMQNNTIPLIAGLGGSAPINIASMKSSGIDIQLSYKKWEGDLKYDVGLNLSRSRNEITALSAGQSEIEERVFGDVFAVTKVGGEVGAFYGYEVEGIFQSDEEVDEIRTFTSTTGEVHQNYGADVGAGDRKYKDQNGDGKLDEDDRVKIGSPTPDFTMGLTSNFEYKGFDLNIFMYLNYGNEVFNATKLWLESDQENSNYATYMLTDAWTPENSGSDIPQLGGDRVNNYSRSSDAYIENGTFLRFRTIQLGYTLPQNICNKYLRVSSLRFYGALQNYFTITSYSGRDPELGNARGLFGQKLDLANYTVPKTITFGLNAKF